MQIPKRRAQKLKIHEDEGPFYVTAQAEQRMRDDLRDLEKNQRPTAVEDVSRSVQQGDLSENAEYQEAKARLARIDGRMFSLKERLKRAVTITDDHSGRVSLGSTVLLSVNGTQRSYQIVGPHESNPTRGRISHLSPLGSALLNHTVGESVEVQTGSGIVSYGIIEVS